MAGVAGQAVMAHPEAVSFSPADITGLRVWFDAAQETGYADNDAITTLTDFSGNGFNMAKVGTNNFTYQTAVLNGLPVIEADGTSYFTTSTTAVPISPTTGRWTAFAVFKPTGVTGVQAVLDNDHTNGTNTRHAQEIRCNGSALETICFNTSGSPVATTDASGTALSAGVWVYATARRADLVLEVRNSGASNGTTAATSTKNLGSGSYMSIGGSPRGSNRLTGQFAEIIGYSTDLSDTDRDAVEAYLIDKWGL